MAMIQCRECGHNISTEAKTCPQCGARVAKPAGPVAIAVVSIIGAIIFAPLALNTSSEPTPTHSAEETAAEKRKLAGLIVAKAVKDSLRDPDSFAIDSLRVDDDGTTVCLQYRARNGFGGMNREIAVVHPGKAGIDANGWNQHCVQPLYEMAEAP